MKINIALPFVIISFFSLYFLDYYQKVKFCEDGGGEIIYTRSGGMQCIYKKPLLEDKKETKECK